MDKPEKNREFAESLGATFPILSDPRREVAKRYGVLIPVIRMAKRVTFVIGKDGVIRAIQRGDEAMDPRCALASISLQPEA